MPRIGLPVQSNSLASDTRTYLAEHDVSDPELLVLVFTVGLITYFVDDKTGSEDTDLAINLM